MKALVLLLVAPLAACASQTVRVTTETEVTTETPEPVQPEADPTDVATLDAIMGAVYDVISGPAGAPRDWDRFRSLFHPELGRLMPVGPGGTGVVGVRGLAPDDYVARSGAYFAENAFFEVEVARRTERYGHIAHVFSTYEARREVGGAPFLRGINSFQLLWDEERWWVLSILWDAETPEQPIPEAYLGTS